MLPGLDASLWKLVLLLVLVPTAAVALLNLAFRRRGGIGVGWGGVIFVLMAAVVTVLVILDKVRLGARPDPAATTFFRRPRLRGDDDQERAVPGSRQPLTWQQDSRSTFASPAWQRTGNPRRYSTMNTQTDPRNRWLAGHGPIAHRHDTIERADALVERLVADGRVADNTGADTLPVILDKVRL